MIYYIATNIYIYEFICTNKPCILLLFFLPILSYLLFLKLLLKDPTKNRTLKEKKYFYSFFLFYMRFMTCANIISPKITLKMIKSKDYFFYVLII